MSAGGTHRGDRKTRAIGDHDGRRMRGRRRVNGGEDTRVGSGVVSGSRVGDPVWPDRRSRSHGAERVGQGRRAPTYRPGQYGEMWGPRRCGKRPWRSTSEHGRRRARSCTAGSLERPHGPRPRVVERCPCRRVPTNRSAPRRSTCEHRRRWVRLTVSTSTAMAATSAPPPPSLGSEGGGPRGDDGSGGAGQAAMRAAVAAPGRGALSPGHVASGPPNTRSARAVMRAAARAEAAACRRESGGTGGGAASPAPWWRCCWFWWRPA
jgi:hypothetical protein